MITLKSDKLTLEISPVGAEIHHVVDQNGVERIWQNESGVWPSHTPLLFPIAGAIKDDTWYYEGKPYTMTKHGYVRYSEFSVEEADDAHAVLALTGEKMKHEGFPFTCELRVVYTLKGDCVNVEYRVKNVGAGDAWFSVGSHEGYACEGGIENFEVVFPDDDELEQTLLDGSLLRHESTVRKLNDHVLTVTPADFLNDALAFTSLRSRTVTLRRKDGAYSVSVNFPTCDTLFVWQKVGAAFLCLEPWHNAPDYVDADQILTHKPGMIRVQAGAEASVAHSLTFR